MSLPVLPTPQKTLTLPLRHHPVIIRAWRVGEEKLLLMAQQGGKPEELQMAVRQILERVTTPPNHIRLMRLPLADVEYLFLNVRALSVDEVVKRNYKCTACGGGVPVDIRLTDAAVSAADNHSKVLTFKVPGTPDIDIEMQYPTLDDVAAVSALGERNSFDELQPLIKRCIKSITIGETVETPGQASDEEWTAFFDSLHMRHLTAITNFFETMPRLRLKFKLECPSCHAKADMEIVGFREFFR